MVGDPEENEGLVCETRERELIVSSLTPFIHRIFLDS